MNERILKARQTIANLLTGLGRGIAGLRAFIAQPVRLAALVAIFVVLWVASGTFSQEEQVARAVSITAQQTENRAPRVAAQRFEASQYPNLLRFQGRSEADRQVLLAAETRGVVEKLPVKKGALVQQGQVICQLETGAREAHYDEARAAVAARRIDYNAARQLRKKGHTSKAQVASAKAAYDAARAGAKARKVELDRTQIRAPFDGILDDVPVFEGDFIDVGRPCASIIDKDPLLITAFVPENLVSQVQIGATGRAMLATGELAEGRIRYLAERPNPVTRTFRVELEVPNEDLSLRDGVSAELQIEAGNVRATRLPQGLLTLNDAGALGIRVIEGDTVAFREVTIASSDADNAWVIGLSETETVITVGHEFVKAGQQVSFVLEGTDETATQDTRDGTAQNADQDRQNTPAESAADAAEAP